MEDTFGCLAACLIGICLGLIGGGGSILTMPVFVYLFHVEPTVSTAYSLFIVGATSLVGGIRHALDDMVDFNTAFVFAVPGFISVYLTRLYLMPLLPEDLFAIGSFIITKNTGIMILFSLIMLAASVSMLRGKGNPKTVNPAQRYNYPLVFADGMVVGVLTGIVGAGGGFLIIPALVLFAGLPMKKAVGTSLLIIAVKSLIGFVGDVHSGQSIHFPFMTIVSLIAMVGIFIGIQISKFIDGENLKKVFGWFVLAMSICMMLSEIIVNFYTS